MCAFYGWNPNSDDVRTLSDIFWIMSFEMIKFKTFITWKSQLEPQAELMGSIANPDVYKSYAEYKEKKTKLKDQGSIEVGNTVINKASSRYVPGVGIVDDRGNIIKKTEELKPLFKG